MPQQGSFKAYRNLNMTLAFSETSITLSLWYKYASPSPIGSEAPPSNKSQASLILFQREINISNEITLIHFMNKVHIVEKAGMITHFFTALR